METAVWDTAKYIDSKEAALEENDTELLFFIVGDIARSKGMTQTRREGLPNPHECSSSGSHVVFR